MSANEVGGEVVLCQCADDCRERIECSKVGEVGHLGCGWCDDHGQARHRCGCDLPTAAASGAGA